MIPLRTPRGGGSLAQTPRGGGSLAQGALLTLGDKSDGGGQVPWHGLSSRRRTAIKKAFRCLDPAGNGFAPLSSVAAALGAAPLASDAAKRELLEEMRRLATPGPGSTPVLGFAAFVRHQVCLSPGLASDADFEELLQAQWGFADVSDILRSMQRHFVMGGLAHAFESRGAPVDPAALNSCLSSVGLQLRESDLLRLCQAFHNGNGYNISLLELKEQVLAPRPETPLPRASGSSGQLTMSSPSRTGRALPAPFPIGPEANGPPSVNGRPVKDLNVALSSIEAELMQLRNLTATRRTRAAQLSTAASHLGPPAADVTDVVSDDDLDAALARMEEHLNHVKAHKPISQQFAETTPMPVPVVDMPHWEHHKYDHHEITAPAWKPAAQVQDIDGDKHASAEYGYKVFGAGSHGHHVSHYHLNDYHGLPHHKFEKQEYGVQKHGDASHHGHWVPHLHGIGTSSHHGSHKYKNSEYGKNTHGKPGHHAHWVPHLHGLGGK